MSTTAVRLLTPGERLEAARGTPVVCVPVYGAHDLLGACLESVLRHTPPDVPVVVADDASPGAVTDALEALLDADRIHYLRQPRNIGFPENVNTVFAAAAPADVVVLNSDCIVGAGWLERLRAAAYCDTNVATATPLTNHGTIVSVPGRNDPRPELPDGLTVDEAAAAVARSSLRLYPRVPTAIGHCMYVRRSALDVIGVFDPAFSPGYGEEVDFSQRCAIRGLVHVVADDVFVFHRGGGSFPKRTHQDAHERILRERYPYYHVAVEAACRRSTGPLPRALAIAARALTGLSVTIDARCLGPAITGTQVHALELVHALWRTGEVRLRVVVPPSLGRVARRALAALDGVEVLSTDDLGPRTPRTQIVHRPYQVFHHSELPALKQLGERIVITHQDMIAFRNPDYARSGPDWLDLHRLTRLTLAFADGVAFFSSHAASDAVAEELVPAEEAEVVQLGVDHRALQPPTERTRPAGLPTAVPDGGYLVCLGTDFKHKNRLFALEVVDELRRSHEWPGWLVFAGPHAAAGTSEQEERALLAARPDLARRTVDLGEVTDEEKQWLYEHGAGVLYPSLYEGFGLVPFEAADAATPCFFAWQTALTETLPESAATLVPWDAASSADAIAERFRDPDRLVAEIREAGTRFLWDKTAREILAVYERAIRRPHRELAQALDGSTDPWEILAAGGPEALARLDVPLHHYRALLAVLSRPVLRRTFLFLLQLVYRAGYVARHRRRPT